MPMNNSGSSSEGFHPSNHGAERARSERIRVISALSQQYTQQPATGAAVPVANNYGHDFASVMASGAAAAAVSRATAEHEQRQQQLIHQVIRTHQLVGQSAQHGIPMDNRHHHCLPSTGHAPAAHAAHNSNLDLANRIVTGASCPSYEEHIRMRAMFGNHQPLPVDGIANAPNGISSDAMRGELLRMELATRNTIPNPQSQSLHYPAGNGQSNSVGSRLDPLLAAAKMAAMDLANNNNLPPPSMPPNSQYPIENRNIPQAAGLPLPLSASQNPSPHGIDVNQMFGIDNRQIQQTAHAPSSNALHGLNAPNDNRINIGINSQSMAETTTSGPNNSIDKKSDRTQSRPPQHTPFTTGLSESADNLPTASALTDEIFDDDLSDDAEFVQWSKLYDNGDGQSKITISPPGANLLKSPPKKTDTNKGKSKKTGKKRKSKLKRLEKRKLAGADKGRAIDLTGDAITIDLTDDEPGHVEKQEGDKGRDTASTEKSDEKRQINEVEEGRDLEKKSKHSSGSTGKSMPPTLDIPNSSKKYKPEAKRKEQGGKESPKHKISKSEEKGKGGRLNVESQQSDVESGRKRQSPTLDIPNSQPTSRQVSFLADQIKNSEDEKELNPEAGKEPAGSAEPGEKCPPHLLPSAKCQSKSSIVSSETDEVQVANKPSQSESSKMTARMDSRSKVTFHCPICKENVSFKNPKVASACFGNHVRCCKKKNGRTDMEPVAKAKKRKRAPETSPVQGTRASIRVAKQHEKVLSERSNEEIPAKQEASKIKNNKPTILPSSNSKATGKSKNDLPKAPKGMRSSYIYFANEIRPQLAGTPVPEMGVIIGERWRALTPKEHERYDKMAIKDRERYTKEKAVFDRIDPSKVTTSSSVDDTEPSEMKNGSKTLLKKDGSSRSELCKAEAKPEILQAQSSYPYAPMGQLWLDKTLACSSTQSEEGSPEKVNVNKGGALIGRRWVWDEGHFVDDNFDPQTENKGRHKGGCTCGSNHLSPLLNLIKSSTPTNGGKSSLRARRSERSLNTYSSSVTEKLADGQLDPHTLIRCEEYEMGPEFRFLKDIQTESVQPFSVRVNPDATFLADLHAHLCDSEIIGLLGGFYSSEERCIYIQAAFPCKSTDRADSGHTDVEMDPVGQIYATEAIANHGMSVVGWYHSHPDFQPNPSITDINNQASYQQLFQGSNESGRNSEVSPFVGLIVGTYDGKNPTSQSVMRWFHVRLKDSSENKSVNFPMSLKMTHRHYRKMAFDNQGMAENIRQSMTSRGSGIRHILESRYLSCPLSGVHDSGAKCATDNNISRKLRAALDVNGKTVDNNDHPVTVISERAESDQPHSSIEADDSNQAHPNNEEENEVNEECSLSLVETEKTPLLLSEHLFDQPSGSKQLWMFRPARPLFFTESEQSMLDMKHGTIPDDVLAGIIWFAIERDQQMLPRRDVNDHSLKIPGIPASSRSILELLLRQSLPSSNLLRKKLYGIIHCLDETEAITLNDHFDGYDAALFHNIDVVLGHYAPKLNKINPFTSWNGAGDKGNISKDCNGCSGPWADFYLTEILQMEPIQSEEGQVYRGGIKMRRGHKITSCLLKWARNMQLDSVEKESDNRATFPLNDSPQNCLQFDHEQILSKDQEAADPCNHPKYLRFVSEVMRLMAARWRECGARGSGRQGTPKRRGRPPVRRLSSLGDDTPIVKRGDDAPVAKRGDDVPIAKRGDDAPIVKRGRGRPKGSLNKRKS